MEKEREEAGKANPGDVVERLGNRHVLGSLSDHDDELSFVVCLIILHDLGEDGQSSKFSSVFHPSKLKTNYLWNDDRVSGIGECSGGFVE
jgi:hypothetical protein